jgi:hypothetical protein
MARPSIRFCLKMLWPHSCQFTASYMQVLWCYSQNSRPMPKIGKKRHSNTLCYTLFIGKAHWLSYLIYQGLYTHQVPASDGAYLWCYSQNSGLVPKIERKAHSNTCSNTQVIAKAHIWQSVIILGVYTHRFIRWI